MAGASRADWLTHSAPAQCKARALRRRGQSPSHDLLRTDSSVDVIYDGVKYSFTYGPGSRVLGCSRVQAASPVPAACCVGHSTRGLPHSTTQSGPQAYTLYLNGAAVEVNARKLSDGGLLIQLNGRSHVTYAKVRALHDER